MIPEAAVEAAEAVLMGYTGGCTCHEGYAGRNLIDPECSYHDVPPEVARRILEAAAPHMLAEAWDEGFEKGAEWGEWGAGPATQSEPDNLNTNPYRSAK